VGRKRLGLKLLAFQYQLFLMNVLSVACQLSGLLKQWKWSEPSKGMQLHCNKLLLKFLLVYLEERLQNNQS
jgi:hypothetical protein